VYENGVLRLLEPVPFKEQELVTVTVSDGLNTSDDGLDSAFDAAAETEADDTVSLEAVRQALAKIPGSMAQEIQAERDERF
jgi:predicted DNA-binding antitoxin AbrB/MazE fold protein